MAGGGGTRGRAGSVLASRSAAPSGLLRQRRIHFPNKQPELTETPPSSPPPPPPPPLQQPPPLPPPPPPSFPPRPASAQAQRLTPPLRSRSRGQPRPLRARAPRRRSADSRGRGRGRGLVFPASRRRTSPQPCAARGFGERGCCGALKDAESAGEARPGPGTDWLLHLREPEALRRRKDRHAVTLEAGLTPSSRFLETRDPDTPPPSARTPPPGCWSRACGRDVLVDAGCPVLKATSRLQSGA
ncbi:protein enabled homolog [Mustela lutreola]|uniref:protein enabled homolog n=1 Tax=Mustela lutreola TaxID=9666 RepID=UPI0027977D1D|nr:protein enabled homolog [Mustela lutreola]